LGRGENREMGIRQQYSKPPLIEAVLELRFENAFTERELTRLKDICFANRVPELSAETLPL